jgi:hypothetical protein
LATAVTVNNTLIVPCSADTIKLVLKNEVLKIYKYHSDS